MNVRDILIKSSKFLNLNNVLSYLKGDIELSDDVQIDLDNLIMSVNMVNSVIASQYIEVIDEVFINNNSQSINWVKLQIKILLR